MESGNYSILIQKLDEFTRKYYKNRIIKGIIYSIALLLFFFLSFTLTEHFAHLDTIGRSILFYLFLGLNGFILTKQILIPGLKYYRLGKLINHKQAAGIIGDHFSNVQDKLLNVLQLNEIVSNGTLENLDLLKAGIDQKINELKPIPFSSAIDLSQNKKYLKYALAPIAILALILIISPGMIERSTTRLVKHNQHFEKEAPFHFLIKNKILEGKKFEDFILEIQLDGEEIPEEAFIEIDDEQFKLSKSDFLNFSYIFKNLQKTTSFRLFADGFYSKAFELSAIPKPALLDFRIKLEYPVYSRKKNETILNSGDITIPEGTKVTWLFKTENTEFINLNFPDTNISIQSEKESFSYTSKFFRSLPYSVSASNQYIKNADSIRYSIEVIKDQAPTIEVREHIDSAIGSVRYFKGNVSDDYGFSKLTFKFIKTMENGIQDGQEIALPVSRDFTEDHFFHTWGLAELNARPGDQFEYYFEICDNDRVNGSKCTRSGKMLYNIPTLDEIRAKSEENKKETKSDLEKTIKLAKDLQKDLDEMNRKILEKKTLSWEEKKKMESLLNKQQQLQQEVEEIQKENKANNRERSEFSPEDEKLLEKQKQLEKLFEEILTDEMKKMLREMEKLMEKMDKSETREMLEKMELNTKDIEKELDRSLELFKQLEFEQKLENTKNKLAELAEKQEKLSEKTNEKSVKNEELKKEQEDIAQKFEEIKKDLKELEKQNKELEQPNQMMNTEREEKNIEKEMQESKKNLEDKKNKKASESQKKAADEMKAVKEMMDKMQEGMEMEQEGEDINQLREILENLVQLSFDQEDVINQLKNTDRNSPNYVKINQQQKKIRDDAKIIEDSLFALSKRVAEIEATVNREISSINMNIDKAIEGLAERQTAQATSRQQYALTSINNLGLLLSEVVKQMQEQMAKQKQGNNSCSKPGKGKPSPTSMRKMQEKLNQQLQKMKEKMEKGKEEGKGKGGMGENGMSEEIAKMAAQQEAIRNHLQKLNQEINKDGKGNMGNLEKLAQMMEQTETDLVNKNITQQTLNRQQEILTRLLQAEKADREREEDEKRQSNESKKQEIGNPSLFLEYKSLKTKETELLKTIPPSVNSFYKKKITEYFNTFDD